MARKKKVKKNKSSDKNLHQKVIRRIPKKREILISPMQVQAQPEQLIGNYCNRAIINHSQREVVFDFLFAIHEHSILVSRVITNPTHAKQILKALGKNIKEYEKKFGEIS